jgi:hypothetical protein
MRCCGQDVKPGIGHSRSVPSTIGLAAAQQFKELYGMGGPDTIRIADYDQRGRFDCRHVIRPVIVFPQQLTHLGEQHHPIFRSWCDGGGPAHSCRARTD